MNGSPSKTILQNFLDTLNEEQILTSGEIFELLEENEKKPTLKRQVSWKSSNWRGSKDRTMESISERKGSNSQVISVYTDNIFEMSSQSQEKMSLMWSSKYHATFGLKKTFV